MDEFKKTMDAKDWTEGLNSVLVKHGEQPVDPGLLIGWFANAIMFGYDEASKPKVEINDGECFVCSEVTNSISANPSLWGWYFPHVDGQTKHRYYHTKCLYPILTKPKVGVRLQGDGSINENIRKKAREIGSKLGKRAELDFGAGAEWMAEFLKNNEVNVKPRVTVERLEEIIGKYYIRKIPDYQNTTCFITQDTKDLSKAIISELENGGVG